MSVGGVVEAVGCDTYLIREEICQQTGFVDQEHMHCIRVVAVEGKNLVATRIVADPGILPGDKVWWQRDILYWTRPGDPGIQDIKIKRVGYSFDPLKRKWD